jgi:hypothetical protein
MKLPSTPTGRKRLLKLADLLEKDAKNKKGIKFDLSYWAKPAKNIGKNMSFSSTATIPMNCGTAACAVGLAVISGIFKRQGFSYTFERYLNYWSDPGNKIWEYDFVPKFRRYSEMEAACKFFSIDWDNGYWLFMEESYSGPTTDDRRSWRARRSQAHP